MKKEVSIKIPEKWSDVSLKTYQDYSSKIDDLTNEDEIVLHSIASLCEVPLDVIKMLKVTDIKTIYLKLAELISVPVNKEIFYKIKINGVKYGFHPCLDEMTLGEFVDIEENAKDGVLSFHKVMSVLYRPIIEEEGNKYKIEPYEAFHMDNAKLFQEINIDTINGVMLFFYNLGNRLLKNSKGYLQVMAVLQNLQREEVTDGLPS